MHCLLVILKVKENVILISHKHHRYLEIYALLLLRHFLSFVLQVARLLHFELVCIFTEADIDNEF